MKTNMTKIAAVIMATSLFAGCSTTNPQTGKQETSAGNTAAVGAAVGALVGRVLGGDNKSMLLGAAAGGGIGYLVGLDARKKELAAAEKVATEIRQETGFVPAVYRQDFKDTSSGQTASGMKSVAFDVPKREAFRKDGDLHPKAVAALVKLNRFAQDNGSDMLVALPADVSEKTFNDVRAVAPNAKIIGKPANGLAITLLPKVGDGKVVPT